MRRTTPDPAGGVLVIDHHDSYTWNLVHLIASVTGELPDVVEHDETVSLRGYSHVVLSPGPGHPSNAADFAQRAVFDSGLPVLGVCLGMQAMVTLLGGRVERIAPAHGEVATIQHDGTGVFADIPQGFKAVRYHSLGAIELPDSLIRTATDASDTASDPDSDTASNPDSSDTAGVTMAVRHRELPLEGVQFHPESILSEHGAQLIANFLGVGGQRGAP